MEDHSFLAAVLRRLGTPSDDIYDLMQEFRAEDYAPLTDVFFPAKSETPPDRRRYALPGRTGRFLQGSPVLLDFCRVLARYPSQRR